MLCFANRVTPCLQHVLCCLQCNFLAINLLFCQPCHFLFKICFALAIVSLIVYIMIYFANCVTSFLEHVVFCQPWIFLFITCFALSTEYLLVYNMCCFVNRVSSCLQHALFCQPCSFLLTTCFVLPTV